MTKSIIFERGRAQPPTRYDIIVVLNPMVLRIPDFKKPLIFYRNGLHWDKQHLDVPFAEQESDSFGDLLQRFTGRTPSFTKKDAQCILVLLSTKVTKQELICANAGEHVLYLFIWSCLYLFFFSPRSKKANVVYGIFGDICLFGPELGELALYNIF